jgi:hypothetical protein
MKIFKFRKIYVLMAFFIFFTEVIIALYIHDSFIRPYFGDFLVVILIYCFVRGFFNIRVRKAAISVLLFSFIVEFLQYLNIVNILSLENNKLAKVVIGTSFSWKDLVCYTLGILLVLLLEKIVRNTKLKLDSMK